MPTSKSYWWRGSLAGILVLLLVGGGYVAWNWRVLQARYQLAQFEKATTEEDRSACAAKLFTMGEPALAIIGQQWRTPGQPKNLLLADQLLSYVEARRTEDGVPAFWWTKLLEESSSFAPEVQAKLVQLVPQFLNTGHPEAAPRCRELVRCALASDQQSQQLIGIRWALRPEVQLVSEVVPLLKAKSPEVRRIALLTVGPMSDEQNPVIGTEELFAWLHDPDADVRQICRSALRTRGLDAEQVGFAQLLSNPLATERLKLLSELRFAASSQSVGQWLERLSQDADPAIRIGAARVAAEMQLSFATWLNRMAETDQDLTVRKWASYYRQEVQRIRPASYQSRP